MSLSDRIDNLVNNTRVANFVDGAMDFIYDNTWARRRSKDEEFRPKVVNSIVTRAYNNEYAESGAKATNLVVALNKIKNELEGDNIGALKKLRLYINLELTKSELEKHRYIQRTIEQGREQKREEVNQELQNNPEMRNTIRRIEKRVSSYNKVLKERDNVLRRIKTLSLQVKQKRNEEEYPQYKMPELESGPVLLNAIDEYETSAEIMKAIKSSKRELDRLERRKEDISDKIFELNVGLDSLYDIRDKIDKNTGKALRKQTGLIAWIRRNIGSRIRGLSQWRKERDRELDNRLIEKEIEKGNLIELEELDTEELLEESRNREINEQPELNPDMEQDLEELEQQEEEKEQDLVFLEGFEPGPDAGKDIEEDVQEEQEIVEEAEENKEGLVFLEGFEPGPDAGKDIEEDVQEEQEQEIVEEAEEDKEEIVEEEPKTEKEEDTKKEAKEEPKEKRFTSAKLAILLEGIRNRSHRTGHRIGLTLRSKLRLRPKKDLILEAKSKIARKSKNNKIEQIEPVVDNKTSEEKQKINVKPVDVVIPVQEPKVNVEPIKVKAQPKEATAQILVEDKKVEAEPVKVEKKEEPKKKVETKKETNKNLDDRRKEIKARLEKMESEDYNAWWTQEHVELERELQELNSKGAGSDSSERINIETKDIVAKTYDRDNKEFVEPKKQDIQSEEERLQNMLDNMSSNKSNEKTGIDRLREFQEEMMTSEQLQQVMKKKLERGESVEGYQERINAKKEKEKQEERKNKVLEAFRTDADAGDVQQILKEYNSDEEQNR